MRKRICVFLLAVCLLAGLLPAGALAAGEDLSPYLSVLQEAEKTDQDPKIYGEAMFFDLDDAAPRELILVRAPDMVHAVVEVYTIRNGEAVRLMSTPLFVMVGGNSGWVSVGEYENKPILICETTAPEVGDDIVTVEGGVKRFALVNGKIEIQESAAYTEVIDISEHAKEDPVLYDRSGAVIQGVWHSYEDFLDWKHSFVLLATNAGFTDEDWDDDAVPFAEAKSYCGSGFWDVKAGSWYAPAVTWAAENGITSGTGPDRFSPNGTCTRGQFVTFLWRAAGKPAGGKAAFSDVKEKDYYYTAVSWAVDKGVTEGVGKNQFAPNATLTRAEVVTFLWRLAGAPKAAGTQKFQDVKAGTWYADAVAWAVQNGITQGTSSTAFSPNAPCTRAQAVTFLYRQNTNH